MNYFNSFNFIIPVLLFIIIVREWAISKSELREFEGWCAANIKPLPPFDQRWVEYRKSILKRRVSRNQITVGFMAGPLFVALLHAPW